MLKLREQLNTTRACLMAAFEGLSEEQLNWRPDDRTWSIAQVVQHIAIVEGGAAQIIALGLAQEPNFTPKEIPLEAMILDRSKKANAPDRLHPPVDPKTVEQLKVILHNSREKFVEALNGIEDETPLNKTTPPMSHPLFGQLSTGQWVVAVPLHEVRHIQQIQELKERM